MSKDPTAKLCKYTGLEITERRYGLPTVKENKQVSIQGRYLSIGCVIAAEVERFTSKEVGPHSHFIRMRTIATALGLPFDIWRESVSEDTEIIKADEKQYKALKDLMPPGATELECKGLGGELSRAEFIKRDPTLGDNESKYIHLSQTVEDWMREKEEKARLKRERKDVTKDDLSHQWVYYIPSNAGKKDGDIYKLEPLQWDRIKPVFFKKEKHCAIREVGDNFTNIRSAICWHRGTSHNHVAHKTFYTGASRDSYKEPHFKGECVILIPHEFPFAHPTHAKPLPEDVLESILTDTVTVNTTGAKTDTDDDDANIETRDEELQPLIPDSAEPDSNPTPAPTPESQSEAEEILTRSVAPQPVKARARPKSAPKKDVKKAKLNNNKSD